jgi:major membrane immunogen (membrane-anchored lipoprotein)
MKKLFLFMLMALPLMFTACSSDDDEEVKPNEAQLIEGTYKGDDLFSTMGADMQVKDAVYTIKAITDSTITVTTSKEDADATANIGIVVTIAPYTVENLKYDAAQKAFVYDYAQKPVKMNIKLGAPKDYEVKKGTMKVYRSNDGKLHVENTYQVGTMPTPLVSKFIGTKQ